MAGVGARLNKIFGKRTIFHSVWGFGYSLAISIVPMVVIIGAVILMQFLLDFNRVDYGSRELYSCTVLYIFIFSLLVTTPFNAIISRYISDVIYNETFGDILPCYFLGLLMNVVLAALIGIPFCIREYIVGGVPAYYVFTGFCGFMALTIVFYSQIYLNISKDYRKISLFFTIGMGVSVGFSLLFVWGLGMDTAYSMLLALSIGFLAIAILQYAVIKSYYRENSGRYREVLKYFPKYWKLMVINTAYTLGLYCHNFVFWTSDMKVVVADSFVSAPSYDLATCVAMFTNISASIIFTARVEMYFHDKYKEYNEAVIGGRLMDIEATRRRLFAQLAEELMNLVRIQFIISVTLFLVGLTLLPRIGMGGITLSIYPCLAAAFFVMFVMYSAMLFQFYFNDMNGALCTSFTFLLVTLGVSIAARTLPEIWYGSGILAGSFAGWCVAYSRLRYMEKNIDIHIFCQGSIVQKGKGRKPDNRVYVK